MRQDREVYRIGVLANKKPPYGRLTVLNLSLFVAKLASQAGFEPATRCLEGKWYRIRA